MTLRLNTKLSVKNEINGNNILSANSMAVTPTTTTKYTLVSTNKIGRTVSKEITINVIPNATISSFTVDGSSNAIVYPNKNLSFTWNSTGTAKTINQTTVTGNSANILAPTETGTYNYVLSVENSLGVKQTASVSISVVPDPIIVSFTEDSYSIGPNQSTTLRLNTAYSYSNLINGTVPSGSGNFLNVSPTTTTTYTLVAKNQIDRTTSKSVTITVLPKTWTATTPTYTNWANTNTLYNCVNWTPNPSTVTTNTTFIQTATCSTDQTRSRQEREVGTYTGVIRNKGNPIVENQTISGSASRSYGVTLSTWTGNTVSSCASWTPDPSTINSGTPFTQTGLNCTLPQARTRTENYIDHKSGANITVSVVNQNQNITVNGTGYINGTRSATGTKAVAPTCQYSYRDPRSLVWDLPGDAIYVLWNGPIIGYLDTMQSSINYGGYRYYAGARGPDYSAYQVCRVPL